MPSTIDSRAMSLSVRLLRQNRSVETALRKDHQLTEVDAENGRLFIGQGPVIPPTWLPFVEQFATGPALRLRSRSCGAVVFLSVQSETKPPITRTMALSFGTGHHALDGDAVERGFGLRVVLNAVARSNLRGIDVATLDATTFLRRVQASRDADLAGFKIDFERDLVRLAAGSPRDPTFARSLAGKDALTLHSRTSSSDIRDKCKKALKLYEAQDYKKDFGFIDFVAPVQDKTLIATLDALAFAELRNLAKGSSSDLHLALPEVLDPEKDVEIGYYGVGLNSGSKLSFGQLAIEDYVDQLKAGRLQDIPDMAALRGSHEVRIVADGAADKKHKRKLYDCLVCEVDQGGVVYVLSGGEWFAVDKAFHATIEKSFQRLLSTAPFVPSTTTTNERDFIAELDGHAELLNMDQVRIDPQGMPGAAFEPCDFLSTKRQFIHLKDGCASDLISHLWNQGIVASESFVRDEKFRKEFRNNAIKRQQKYHKAGFEKLLPDGRSKPDPSQFTIVFGIMRSRYLRSGTLGIPFFSKVSLRAAADRIKLMGFNIEVHLVEKPAKKRGATATKKAA
jgi:uncharacterized protein (TIGR04141 family)